MRAKHTTMETRRFTKKAARGKKKKRKLQNSQKKNDISKPKFSRRKEITNIGAKNKQNRDQENN